MKAMIVKAPFGFDIPAGGIILWYGNAASVPAGYSIVTELGGYFAMGASTYDATARGALTHTHTFPNVETKANHNHPGSTANVSGGYTNVTYGGYYSWTVAASSGHSHGAGINVAAAGGHTHTIGTSGSGSNLPKHKRLYYIKKD